MLDYEARISRYEETREDIIWRLRRDGYYLTQFLFFVLISLWLGPNLFLFGRVLSPRPAEFVSMTQVRYAPVVAAIKAYQRDHGSLPYSTSELTPTYLPDHLSPIGNICGTTTVTFQVSEFSGVLAYDFAPATEGWLMYSPRFQGRIPAPLVPPAPATRPAATQPTVTGE